MYTTSKYRPHLKYLLITVVVLTYVHKLFYMLFFPLSVDLVIYLLKLWKEKNRNHLSQVIKFTSGKSY